MEERKVNNSFFEEEDELYDLSLEELQKVQAEMREDDPHRKLVSDLIHSKIRVATRDIEHLTKEELEDLLLEDELSLEELKEMRSKIKETHRNFKMLDDAIRSKLRIATHDIEHLSAEELEVLIYEEELSPFEWLLCKKFAKKYQFDDFNCEHIEAMLKESLEDTTDLSFLAQEEVKAMRAKVDYQPIDLRISEIRNAKKAVVLKEREKRRERFWTGVSFLADWLESNDKKKKKKDLPEYPYLMPWGQELVDSGDYEPYQFEEEEMDEDDYYSEDDID